MSVSTEVVGSESQNDNMYEYSGENRNFEEISRNLVESGFLRSRQRRKSSENNKIRQKYMQLREKIEKDQQIISDLRRQNEDLRREIEWAKNRISQLPETKKRYDQLSFSISEANSSIKRKKSAKQ